MKQFSKSNNMDNHSEIQRRLLVTEPFLPPLEEYAKYLEGIWSRRQLTNQGPLVAELERRIKATQNLSAAVHCVANGGLGLQILLKAMGVGGEVITTPYSYIATTSCPLWEGCSVRYADIEPDTLTIDPKAVEAAITPRTEAIIATHVYGNPCDCDALESIAARHGIALVFDAAHAHGVVYQGRSILSYGDASMVSLHATKIFHACEGGYVVARDPGVSEKVEWMRRFGHDGHEDYHGVGINAKLSELHAAMGLCVCDRMADVMAGREEACKAYDDALKGVEGARFAIKLRETTQWNSAYYPLRFASEAILLAVLQEMESEGIMPRRYFYPALHSVGLPGVEPQSCPVADKVASEVMCLPLSARISEADRQRVIGALFRQIS